MSKDKNTTKILTTFTEAQIASLEKYAKENDLMYGGKPNVSAAIRELCALGLGVDPDKVALQTGNPNFQNQSK